MKIEIIANTRIKVELDSGSIFDIETTGITEDYLIISKENKKLEFTEMNVEGKKAVSQTKSLGFWGYIKLT